eukprot:scaffold6056_cov90-Isochrysis_galbana.AAC.1
MPGQSRSEARGSRQRRARCEPAGFRQAQGVLNRSGRAPHSQEKARQLGRAQPLAWLAACSGACGAHLEIAVYNAETVQPDQRARNAGKHQDGVDLPRNPVVAQAVPRVLEHEVQPASLLECTVGGHDIRVGPGEADVPNLAEQRLTRRFLPARRLLHSHCDAQQLRLVDLRVAAVRQLPPVGRRGKLADVERLVGPTAARRAGLRPPRHCVCLSKCCGLTAS